MLKIYCSFYRNFIRKYILRLIIWRFFIETIKEELKNEAHSTKTTGLTIPNIKTLENNHCGDNFIPHKLLLLTYSLHQRNRWGRLVNLTVFALQKNCTLIYISYCKSKTYPWDLDAESQMRWRYYKKKKKTPFIFQIKVNPTPIIAIKLTPFAKKPKANYSTSVSSSVGIERFSPNTLLQSKLSKRCCFHKGLWKLPEKQLH